MVDDFSFDGAEDLRHDNGESSMTIDRVGNRITRISGTFFSMCIVLTNRGTHWLGIKAMLEELRLFLWRWSLTRVH